MASGKSIVLYVEDEESDRLLMRMAFQKAGLEPELRVVGDGQAAIDYFSGVGPYAERAEYPLPAVVLLDLNLPEVHGFDVLKWIRGQPGHSQTPVVVFTSSAREEDRHQAQLLGATEFLQKPGMLGGFQDVARKLHEEWVGEKVERG